MPKKHLVDWYKKSMEDGLSKGEVIGALLDMGYSKKEINGIIAAAEKQEIPEGAKKGLKELTGFPELPKKPEKSTNEILLDAGSSRRIPKTEPFSEFVNRESRAIWKFILAAILIILLLVGTAIFFLRTTPEIVDWIPTPPRTLDDIPPKVSVITPETGWMSLDNIKIECTDSGIDFSSGCNKTTYVYHFSNTNSCPKDYSVYSITPTNEKKFLCGAAKDNEGNPGFSMPVEVKFDGIKPKSWIEERTGWFDSEFSVNVSDSDEGSGIKHCSYNIISNTKIILENVERKCNSNINIPIGKECNTEGKNACTLQAYATDNAGNKGEPATASFDIDLNAPHAEILSINPSTIENNILTVNGKIDITGTAEDHNIKQYTLEWKREGASRLITKSNYSAHNKKLGTLDTEGLSNLIYTLVLTAEDLSGKISSDELEIKISNTGVSPCDEGEIELCSSLDGVCSSSERVCLTGGIWGECKIEDATGYENPETSCEDGLDNDCDGDTDDEDADCSAGCSDECSVLDDPCNTTTNTIYTCTDCNEDPCLEWCNPIQCFQDDGTGNCQCTCGDYTTGDEDEMPGGCGDSIDNDCDGLTDCDDLDCASDPICTGGCDSDGDPCPPDNCCHECDPTDNHCFTCTDNKDPQDGNTCEADDCGADAMCDELAPQSIATDNNYCCASDCSADNTVGTCTCSGGTCNGGYCLIGNTCHHGVTCEGTGWTGSSCLITDSCGSTVLVTGRGCTGTGCTPGITNICNSSTHTNCEEQSCGGTSYNCTFDGTWEWRSSLPTENCTDLIDNDCDGYIDDNDSDCGSSCKYDGESCIFDSDCCSYPSGGCDSSDGLCYSCNGNFDQTGLCEEGCGADSECDEHTPGSISTASSRYCCDSVCSGDDRIADCSCWDHCVAGWCEASDICYYNITCEVSGWEGDNCMDEECTPGLLLDYHCSALGCTDPYLKPCNDTHHDDYNCTARFCLGTQHYCSHNGTGWAWRASYSQETGNCGDGEDNDCDGYTDCEDSDCASESTCDYPVELCFEAALRYVRYKISENEYYYTYAGGGLTILYVGRRDYSGSDQIRRGVLTWDTSPIADTVTVTGATFGYDCYSRNPLIDGHIWDISEEPSMESDDEALYEDAGNGTLYAGSSGNFPELGTYKEINLGADAVNHIQTKLSEDWFSIGLITSDESTQGYTYALQGTTTWADPPPTLCVTFIPNPP